MLEDCERKAFEDMESRKKELILGGIVLLSFLIGICFYPQMPDPMVTHWNTRGEADGYMSRSWGLFLVPLVLAGTYVLFLAIPKIDPLKENIQKFQKYYYGIMMILFLFLLAIYFHLILWNLGVEISPNLIIPLLLAPLFYYLGVLCEHSRRNWFIGIRTPWTLSSDKVWKKTHILGGKIFRFSAFLVLFGAAFPNYALYFILVPAIVGTLAVIIYSYIIYKEESP